MRLVVGLGNPGNEYKNTYHNIGFDAVDALASRFVVPDFKLDRKSNALISDCTLFGERVLLCEPQTYMNLSGIAVLQLVRYYKIEPQNLIVAYDDIDIGKGTVRARTSGSAGTHNGMRDIIGKLGFTDFPRVRIGTGFRPPYMALADYVLSHIPAVDRELMVKSTDAACDFIEDWLKGKEWTELTKTIKN